MDYRVGIMTDFSGIQQELLAWYQGRKRNLPWREDPSPYRVWVSEIMLQQTQVATVIGYFERFIDAFPDVFRLAQSPLEDVLSRWAGLGYYRRCRHLHQAAQMVVSEYGGRIPSERENLLKLPGIGRYTAGAIASIAFDQPEALLDGNVTRVLARLFALDSPANSSEGQRFLWEQAETLLNVASPSAHNQALMELGALVCRPHKPCCGTCPLRGACRAFQSGKPEAFPVKKARPRPKPVSAVAAVVVNESGDLLMARRPEDGLLGGLWELPGGEVASKTARKASLKKLIHTRMGLSSDIGRLLATVEHTFTHRVMTVEIYQVTRWTGEELASWYTDFRWLPCSKLDAVPLSRLTQKVLHAIGHFDV